MMPRNYSGKSRRSSLSLPASPGKTSPVPEIAINHLTSGIFDQESLTPVYKVVAVRLASA